MAVKTVVIDASVAIKWFLQEPDRSEAMMLQSGHDLIAPDLIVAEVLNAIWRNIRIGTATPAMMSMAAAQVRSAFVRLPSIAEFGVHAGEISLALDHPAYDCFYIALAEREGVEVVTADRRLIAKTRGTVFESFVKPLVP